MEIKVQLTEENEGNENKKRILDGFTKIMKQDLRVQFIKCNKADVNRIRNLGIHEKFEKEETYAGAKLWLSEDVKKSEVILISEREV